MKRRNFIKSMAVAGAGVAASTLAAPAIAQGKRQLKMVTSWPKNLPVLGTGAERLARRIAELTEEQITIKVYSGGELVPPFGVFDAVSSGTADLYHTAPFLHQGKHKAFNYFAAVPFGLTGPEVTAWIYFSGGQALWDELDGKYNVKPFPCGNSGVSMFGWLTKEIKSLDDLKGLKYRIPGVGGEILRRLGVAVTNIPPAEIMAAFQSGAIDGTEWGSPLLDIGLGFHKIAKFYFYPGFHEPGVPLELGINLNVWNSLSKQHQALVKVAADADVTIMLSEVLAGNAPTLKALVKDHGVKVRKLPDDVLKSCAKLSTEVLGEMAAGDALTKKIHDSYIGFRESAMEWADVGEGAFIAARKHLVA